MKWMVLLFWTICLHVHGQTSVRGKITGRWADHIGLDVVSYIDSHFRTLADRNSRGVTGISMGMRI